MDRSVAGRGGIGRINRLFAPAYAGRARSSRRRTPAAGAWRGRAWRLPRLHVPLVGDALSFVWRRRRLRLALAALAAVAILLAGGWLGLRHSSLVAVQHVRISGVHGPDAAAIDAALTGAARHMSTLDVRVGALRAAAAPFPVVREVRAVASFPHTLRIHVVEQLPVAALLAGGVRTAVAADGVVLGPALLSGSLPTVAATLAPGPGERVRDAHTREALAVIGAVPGPLARFVVRAYTGAEGLTVAMRSGLNAYFGDASLPHAKWLSLALVLANERSAGAAYVDVRVPARPSAGFAGGSGPPPTQGTSSSSSTGEGAATTEAAAGALAAAVGREHGEHGGGSAPTSTSESPSEQSRSTPSEQSRSAVPGEAQAGSTSAAGGSGASGEGPEHAARAGP
jgi:cell division protein FtsQ